LLRHHSGVPSGLRYPSTLVWWCPLDGFHDDHERKKRKEKKRKRKKIRKQKKNGKERKKNS
jgi:hypothetical protein